MNFFKFGKNREKVRKKSSSMGSLYKDYGTENVDYGVGDSYIQPVGNYNERAVDAEIVDPNELRKQNDALQQENNLLKLKVEVLLDMLAQKTAEAEMLEGDILKMKNFLANV